MRTAGTFAFITFLIILGLIAKSYWGLPGQIGVLLATALLWLLLWLVTRFFESRTRAYERELAELDRQAEEHGPPVV